MNFLAGLESMLSNSNSHPFLCLKYYLSSAINHACLDGMKIILFLTGVLCFKYRVLN